VLYLAFLNPLNLPGPQFLGLYVIILFVAVIIALALRYLMKGRLTGPVPPVALLDVDPYEAAYLMGGEKQAVETAIAVLVKAKKLKVEASDRTLLARGALAHNAHSLERAVYDEAGRYGEEIDSVRARASAVARQLAVRLCASGLIFNEAQAWYCQVIPALLVSAVTVFGAMKILIGISRDRPVGFLILLTILSIVIACYFFKRRPHRTPLGDLFADLLKTKNAALEQTARTHPGGLDGADLALALGLFGINALPFATRPLSDLRAAMRPRGSSSGKSGSGGSFFSFGSSCSSSSCGSSSCSSGCGGGGGGGCGGCGS
jgi:uncharacterized protein (TIGR04222 family)